MKLDITLNGANLKMDFPANFTSSTILQNILNIFVSAVSEDTHMIGTIKGSPPISGTVNSQITDSVTEEDVVLETGGKKPIKQRTKKSRTTQSSEALKPVDVNLDVEIQNLPRLTFSDLIKKINTLVRDGKINTTELLTLIESQGIKSLGDLKDHEDILPTISVMLDEKIGLISEVQE